MDSAVSPPSPAHRYRIGEVGPAEAPAMRALFERVFGKPMSPAFWDWKYRQSGGHGIGVWDGDRMIAHYGGAGTEALFEGHFVPNVQICDVMVEPGARHAVRQLSPYFLATSTFIERFVGQGKRFLMGYGFPSDRHLALAVHLGFYAEVGTMSELRLGAVQPAWSDWLYHWQPLDVARDHWQVAAEALWESMQRSLPGSVLLRKDAARLQYRYVAHPEHRYEFWCLRQRLGGHPLALVVLKEEPDRILLMDVIGEQGQLARVLRMTAAAVRRRWSKPLVFWLSTVHADALHLPGSECTRLPISTPANVWTDSPAPERLKDRWWLTAGDTDFL